MTVEQQELLREFQNDAKTGPAAASFMERMSHRLHEKMARYNWVGFYLVDPSDPNILMVGAYVGSFAPNVRIPLDRGLCGAAARERKTIIVDDVSKDPRYLAGSSMVVSEIVVPIFLNKKLIGEFDVESYFPATFKKAEQEFVEACADLVGQVLGKEASARKLAAH